MAEHKLRTLVALVIATGAACASPRVYRPEQPSSPPSAGMAESEGGTFLASGLVTVSTASAHSTQHDHRVRAVGTCRPSGDSARFSIAHFNDLQARYSDRIAGKSRYGYIAGYLRALKAETPATLVLDAGDDYEKGAIAELRSMGESTREMVQALPIDARTIGNHDFAYGESAVLRDVTLSAHPVLSSNMRSKSGERPFATFARFDVGCVKVGIIGLTTNNFGADDSPTHEPFNGVFEPDPRYLEVAREIVRARRAEVDVVIALDHIGLHDDVRVAAGVSGVDLVVGGHSEDRLSAPRAITRADGSRAWVVQAGHFGQALGRLDLAFDRRTRKLSVVEYALVNVDERLPYAEDVGDLASRLEAQSAPDAHKTIATVRSEIAEGEAMSQLVWRAVRERWQADALLVGRDLFWDRLPPGPLSLQALYESVLVQRQPAGTPGFSSLYITWLTGKELRSVQNRLIVGSNYAFYAPDSVVMDRKYRVVVEKRATLYPKRVFVDGYELPEPRFGGELIDVLEPYARHRTARGLTLL
jgi:5'-nucleotidase/UDP-sugar diphosphatase